MPYHSKATHPWYRIQQSMATNEAAPEIINYYKLLGGGKEPHEEWETYKIEVKQLEASDERVTKAQHSRLLTDAKGKTDPFFCIRLANSNLENIAMTKLLINKVILAWKHILRDKLEVAKYITTSFLWIGVKAKFTRIFIGQNFLMYHLQQRLLDHTLNPHPPSHYGTQLSNPTTKCIQVGHQPMMA
jgi:hypothetical protein